MHGTGMQSNYKIIIVSLHRIKNIMRSIFFTDEHSVALLAAVKHILTNSNSTDISNDKNVQSKIIKTATNY